MYDESGTETDVPASWLIGNAVIPQQEEGKT